VKTIMAEREHTKTMAKTSARPPAKPQPRTAIKPVARIADKAAVKTKTPVAELPASAIKRLEAENVQLSQVLAVAQARIAELERQRDGALDRIGWVIDSLHSLREQQG
jgi:hypothetical protein